MDAQQRRIDSDGDPGHSEQLRLGELPPGATHAASDAERLGLDRNSVEGAQVAFFSSLNGAKRSHKVVAWVVLALWFGPVLLYLLFDLFR